MQVGYRWLMLMATLLVARRSFVTGAPTQYLEGVNNGGGGDVTQGGDEDVKELERLKPKGNSLTLTKTHSTLYTNLNGQKEHHSQTKEEVDKDGEVMARVSQAVDKTGNVPAHVKTQVDVPSRNIHKVLEEVKPDLLEQGEPAQAQSKRIPFPPSQQLPFENNAESYKYPGLHYSPLDMAEYVFWTGDEKGVTLSIEEFLQNGLMSRDEAIGFLMDIKQNLDYLQTHYNEDRYHNQQTKEKNDERGVGPELNEVRQQMQDNLVKKSEIQDTPMGGALSEDDYEELLEKLRLADLLYNEYSLEEVIYQLAKLMFTQSLTRGSAEAQDTLQKFTNFLESEAQQGRISRNLEKKVLDVLIASLSDTLNEHPELVNTARESLGVGGMSPNEQLIQQFVNQGKPEVQNGSQSLEKGKEAKGHRFEAALAKNMKKASEGSGLQSQEKSST